MNQQSNESHLCERCIKNNKKINVIPGTRLCDGCLVAVLKTYLRTRRTKQRDMEQTNLYAIVEIDEDSITPNYVKFGISIKPRDRLSHLKGPRPLILYGHVPCVAMLEGMVHDRLGRYRVSGEWFKAKADPVRQMMELIRQKKIGEIYDFCGLAKIRELLVA